MKTLIKTVILGICLGLLTIIVAIPSGSPLSLKLVSLQLVPEAHAILGVRRRSMRRGVIIGSSMAATSAAAAPAPAPAPAPVSQPVGAPPIGSIIAALPAGCVTSPIGGVEYYNCNGVFYRSAFQGNNLVYVVSQP
jgi:hypothetical protein